MAITDSATIYQRPAELLQQLIRFDTTNPPGNEADCVAFIDGLLKQAGVQTTLLARTPQRPNLIARLAGEGKAPPLLLYGHVDVVTTENQPWTQPPFEGLLQDGFIWGRGALDMKGGVAMMLAAFLRAKAENKRLPGDVVLAIVSDEEHGGDFGAKYLVEEHPEQFQGIRYALGEFGGFSMTIGGKRFYPIQIAEKQMCLMRLIVRGQGGHGSIPVRGQAMAKLARLLHNLDRHRLPVHVTPAARLMIESLSAAMGGVQGFVVKQLLNPLLSDRLLDQMGENSRLFDPLLHNTVSPTVLHASDKFNVIPNEISVGLDGRLLPGFTPEDMLTELGRILGPQVEFEVIRYDPGPADPDMGLFDTLAQILRQADPQGIPLPYVLSAITDARFFSKLGIQTYGFLPMQLPEGFNFSQTIHTADERIPVEAVQFGSQAIFQALQLCGV